MPLMRHPALKPFGLFALCFALALAAGPARATEPQAAKPDAKKAAVPELTPEEKKEKEMRSACKALICGIYHNKLAQGADVSCNVIKSWRKETLNKMISKARISWPWGKARCQTQIKLKRDMLAKAIAEPKLTAKIDTHTITCEIEREKGPYTMKFDLSPTVTFEKGKAVSAKLGWGKIEAPALAKSAIWSAAKADSFFGVFEKSVVEDINKFFTTNCLEVKDAWAK
ncbi:MAG: hypothetical protein KDJ41_03650 [Hyphomicrobiaceae bacterium]|nr:hypothetical protein [Hyphomicrobiaceae bacterium]